MQRIVTAPAGIPSGRLAKDKTYKRLLNGLGENDDFMNGAQYDKVRVKRDKSYTKLVRELTQ